MCRARSVVFRTQVLRLITWNIITHVLIASRPSPLVTSLGTDSPRSPSRPRVHSRRRCKAAYPARRWLSAGPRNSRARYPPDRPRCWPEAALPRAPRFASAHAGRTGTPHCRRTIVPLMALRCELISRSARSCKFLRRTRSLLRDPSSRRETSYSTHASQDNPWACYLLARGSSVQKQFRDSPYVKRVQAPLSRTLRERANRSSRACTSCERSTHRCHLRLEARLFLQVPVQCAIAQLCPTGCGSSDSTGIPSRLV